MRPSHKVGLKQTALPHRCRLVLSGAPPVPARDVVTHAKETRRVEGVVRRAEEASEAAPHLELLKRRDWLPRLLPLQRRHVVSATRPT